MRGVSMERSKVDMKEKDVPTAITIYSKYNNNKHNMVVSYKIWKNYNDIQFTKKNMDFNNRKIKNHPSSPVLSK